MKYMNLKNKYSAMNLQLFAGDDGGSGSDDDDNSAVDDNDPDDDGEDDNPDEKRFSQKDMDDAVKKRLAREKRKWQREQNKSSEDKPDGGDSAGNNDKEKDEAISKTSRLEVKVACFEADVAKESVDDVAALAHAYMAADKDLDLEDAIEKVVKKYPQFKKGAADPYEEDDETNNKAWGQRQKGVNNKTSGVEAAFMKKNPGLKL